VLTTSRGPTAMLRLSDVIHAVMLLASTLLMLSIDVLRFLCLCFRPSPALAAENLFLRKQLALYKDHHITPKCTPPAIRFALVWLSRWFDWQHALTIVQPETFARWRRQGFGVLWCRHSRAGRPAIPAELQALIRQMACDNLTWGQRRIANELRLKLGLRVSPRTVRKYLPTPRHCGPGQRATSQCWRTFLRNHAWDLLVRSVAADLTRGRQALCARIIRIVQEWWNRSGASRRRRRTPRRDTTWLSWRSAPASGLAV
jgi:hypothetical protein